MGIYEWSIEKKIYEIWEEFALDQGNYKKWTEGKRERQERRIIYGRVVDQQDPIGHIWCQEEIFSWIKGTQLYEKFAEFILYSY